MADWVTEFYQERVRRMTAIMRRERAVRSRGRVNRLRLVVVGVAKGIIGLMWYKRHC